MRMKKVLALLAMVSVLTLPTMVRAQGVQPVATANTPAIKAVQTQIGANMISYPQLEGLQNAQIQQQINDAIVEKGKIAQRMVTLTTLEATGNQLKVDYEAFLTDDVFSTVINAVGTMENGRDGQEYAALSYNLLTGEPLTLKDLFQDPEAAVTYMEETLMSTYVDEISSYLENGELTPLPRDSFSLDADGITFYYPRRQFSMLSGYSGAAQFNYDELAVFFRTDQDALAVRLGMLPTKLTDGQIKAGVREAVEKGMLPHTRVTLGQPMTEAIAAYRLLRTPDQYPGGRYFQLEAPAFRQVLVLSDALTSGWENSKVEGILTYRANLYGIRSGSTTQSRWREILGTPENSVAFDEDMAGNYGFPVGTADYYTFGEHQLLLYADENGMLLAVRLT